MQKETTIDDYIAGFPSEVQTTLKTLRKTIKEIIPDTEETISYGIPTFKRNGKYVVYFAGFKHHISIYPILSDMEELPELQEYKKGRGTLQFPLDKPVPIELIKKVVVRLSEENKVRAEKK